MLHSFPSIFEWVEGMGGGGEGISQQCHLYVGSSDGQYTPIILPDWDTCIFDGLGRTTRGHKLQSNTMKTLGKVNESRLVGDTQQS